MTGSAGINCGVAATNQSKDLQIGHIPYYLSHKKRVLYFMQFHVQMLRFSQINIIFLHFLI